MMVKRLLMLLLIAPMMFAPPSAVYAQTSGPYRIDWWTVNGGGGPRSGGSYTTRGSIGQPVTGSFQGGSYTLLSGFWAGVTQPSEPVDLVAGKLEVTQAIQDLNNSVPLIAGKRTFVRFHVRATDKTHRTFAQLRVQRGNEPPIWLAPAQGRAEINVRQQPDRGHINDAFLFELPTKYTQGTVSLQAEVNPQTPWRQRTPAEISYANNLAEATISFTPVPNLAMRIIDIVWRDANNVLHAPTDSDRLGTVEDILSQFPIANVNWDRGNIVSWPGTGSPDLGQVIQQLDNQRRLDGSDRIYYGLLVGNASNGIVGLGYVPGSASAGYFFPSDPAIAAHELGHNFGRWHTRCRGDEQGIQVGYPYADGHISQEDAGDRAFYGFHTVSGRIYPPSSGDLMGYCRPNRASDWTYKAIMTAIRSRFGQQVAASSLLAVGNAVVLVSGDIEASGNTGTLHSIVQTVSSGATPNPEPGPYQIRFEDGSGQELAAYTFTPTAISDSPQQAFSLLLPHVDGVARIRLLHNGQELDVRTASAHAPVVAITSHADGDSLAGSGATVRWSASDADDDALRYTLQVSTDDGTTWQTLITSWAETSYELDPATLASSNRMLLRILASDGFHTTGDQKRVIFPAADRVAQIDIIQPSAPVTIAVSQTLALIGSAYDVKHGSFDDAQILWTSDRDGLLGTGAQLSVAGLSVGQHTITLHINDGANTELSDAVQVTVVENPAQLPAIPDALVVDTAEVGLNPSAGILSATIAIDNQNILNALPWQAQSSQPWLTLNHSSGTTPATLILAVDPARLPSGPQTAIITFTSGTANAPAVRVEVQVENSGQPPQTNVFLPLVTK